MKKILTPKELKFFEELRTLLLKYNAILQRSADGDLEFLVFEGVYKEEETIIPVKFTDIVDETDIDALFRQHRQELMNPGLPE